uniref:Uncharacterized protein n=1 Tax=Anguilla anguilla TaxID=7936 RepID=A0A0E9XDI6_ANGAN
MHTLGAFESFPLICPPYTAYRQNIIIELHINMTEIHKQKTYRTIVINHILKGPFNYTSRRAML